MKKIAIIGAGWVGKAMKSLFPEAYIYTTKIGKKERVNECDVVFICIPTPNVLLTPGGVVGEGALDTSMIDEIMGWCECPLIVVRSTVNPGDCDRWTKKYNRHIVFQPEYLGETPNHPFLDQKSRPFFIIGGNSFDRDQLISLYTDIYNANVDIRLVTNYEAEVIKLSENRAIAFKVAECQELYDACRANNVDYYTVRQAVYGDDPRFNLWFSFIYPEKRGFNSKCIPKDIYGWCTWAESAGYNPKITRALLAKNKEWI